MAQESEEGDGMLRRLHIETPPRCAACEVLEMPLAGHAKEMIGQHLSFGHTFVRSR